MRKPARKGKYKRVKVVPVALPTKPSGPFNSNRINKIGNEIAVAMARPAIPPLHAAHNRATAAMESEGKEIAMDLELNARTISRIPSTTAVAKTTRNNSLYTESENQINPSKERPTAIDGSSFRPAFLLIASLIECMSDMSEPLIPRGVQPPCA